MLGPSDIRKNISTFMPAQERCQRALKRFPGFTFPDGTSREQALANLQPLVGYDRLAGGRDAGSAFVQLTNGQLARLAGFMRAPIWITSRASSARAAASSTAIARSATCC